MFIWLGLALIVDGIDGPLARKANVEIVLPRFSGERLDLIVDYLTYVAIPAFALARADILPEAFRLPAAIAILLSSLFHVADRDSKTKDGYFVGFPAIWNIVCLYLFAFMPPPAVSLGCDPYASSLLPLCRSIMCIHCAWSAYAFLTLIVTGLWSAAAIGAVLNPFPSPLWVRLLLASTALYFICIGVLRSHGGARE